MPSTGHSPVSLPALQPGQWERLWQSRHALKPLWGASAAPGSCKPPVHDTVENILHFFLSEIIFYCQSEPVLLQSIVFHSHPPSRQLWEKANPASLVTNSSQSFPFSREQALEPSASQQSLFQFIDVQMYFQSYIPPCN